MEGYFEQESSLTGRGDVKLFCKAWKAGQPRGKVIIAHGLGEHCDRYRPLLETLQGQGISFYALDHRGHGRSGGQRGHVDRFNDYVGDLKLLFDQVKQEEKEQGKNVPLILLGHSMGGVIAFQYALDYPEDLNALILSSAGLIPTVEVTLLKRIMAGLLSRLAPRLSMSTGLDPNLLSHDKRVVEAYMDDPLVHGVVSTSWYAAFTGAGEECLKRSCELTLPLLIIHGKEDGIVDYHGSEEVMVKASSADKQLFIFDGLYHETMNELPPGNQKVLNTIREWILRQL